MYKLLKAKEENIQLLIKYKLDTIFEYAINIDETERAKIINYVNNKIPQQVDKYKLIVIDSNIAGCLLVDNYEDGVILEEIYIEEEYRNLGIGSKIISDLIKKQNIIYLWVYKDNKKAIKLYERFGFKVIEETETRCLMRYN
jgi:ribosomal protein S18 acetylase RimI-like enzyme